MPHVRNNTYRLLRLVEEMVLDGKSGEKEQELMHKRQETYEKRLKNPIPTTVLYGEYRARYVFSVRRETCTWNVERNDRKIKYFGLEKKKMWQTILKIAEEYADYVVPETCDANVEKFYDKESDEVILLSPPVGTPKQRKSGRKKDNTTEEKLLAQRHG